MEMNGVARSVMRGEPRLLSQCKLFGRHRSRLLLRKSAMHPLAETDGTVRARRQERLHRISLKAGESSNGSLRTTLGQRQ